jgi:hypothetical protein
MVGTAQADLFTFDPTGTAGPGGNIAGVNTIDPLPGNVLALGGGPANVTVGAKITDLYQANLGTMVAADGTTILFANGTGGKFFTFVAGFGETVTAVSDNGAAGIQATFAFDPTNPTNFFYICAQSAGGNNLAGTGFACANPILTGVATAVSSSQTVTSVSVVGGQTIPTSAGALDQNGTDNRSPTQTVASNGSADLTVRVTFADSNYFPDLFSGTNLVFSFTNTSLITPFKQADPSFLFSSNGHANGDVADNIGTVNGLNGPNFQFQADANTSFVRVVPEPATIALLGLGLTGLGVFARKRRRA